MAEFNVRGNKILLDDEDLELVSNHSWWMNPQGYPCTKIRYAPGRKNRRTVAMHRLILGDPSTPSIDHTNRNKLDNRKSNLVTCSDGYNNRNKPTRKNKTSKYRGVSFSRGKWQVVLRVNSKLKWLGYYDTEKQAAKIAAPHFAGIPP